MILLGASDLALAALLVVASAALAWALRLGRRSMRRTISARER